MKTPTIFSLATIFLSLFLTTRVLGQTNMAGDTGSTTVTNGVEITKNLPYVSNAGLSNQLDLYRPQHFSGKLPIIMMIHGGGWYAGDKGDFKGPCMALAARGYATAAINYRLSGEALFPAQIVDCKAAARWLKTHADQYGLDPGRLVVGGHSAGAHLAALMGVTDGVKKFDQGENLDVSSNVQAVLWYAGVSDFVARGLTPGYEAWLTADCDQAKLIGGPMLQNKKKALEASPITYVSAKSVPFIIFHGDKDSLVPWPQALQMHVRLQEEGVYSELHLVAGGTHDGPFFAPDQLELLYAFLTKLKLSPLPPQGQASMSSGSSK